MNDAAYEARVDEVTQSLLDLDGVIAEPLKFKRKLRIGEDAYVLLRLKNRLQAAWDVSGVAASGASVAASKIVATTFFSGGLLSAFGLGAAATPVGWVVAAAVVSGGAYYGVTRLVQRRSAALVETIPRFINAPIDLLGMQLLDLIGALALRVAAIDDEISVEERQVIERHFVEEWGYDGTYVARALDVLQASPDPVPVKAIARALAEFQAANPDCNGEAMRTELLGFLRDVIEADGVLDEREELAIDAVAAQFREEGAKHLRQLGKALADTGDAALMALKMGSGTAADALKDVKCAAGAALKDVSGAAASQLRRGLARAPKRKPPG